MTKEDVIEILERFVIGAKPCSQREIVDACASAYRMLKEQPSIPPNLDEAAEESAKEWRKNPDGSESREIFFQPHIRGFKAGAEWMAGQGVKLRGRVLPGPRCNLYIESDCFDRGYKGLNYSFSDSNDVDMFVQIRKK